MAAVILSAVASDVVAHARLKRANPAVGGIVSVSAVPVELQVWFTEPVEPALSTIRVVNSAGAQMDRGDLERRLDRHASEERLLPVPGRAMTRPRLRREDLSISW